MIIQPIIGHYSDQTWCRLGRRRPFFLVGAIFTTIALILMPNAGLFLSPGTETAILSPVLIGAGMLMIMDASINVTMEPFRALVGDMLPDEQHTTGFSIQTFLIGIGAVVGSLLPSIMNKVFGLSNTAVAGEVADNVKFAFYAGAAYYGRSLRQRNIPRKRWLSFGFPVARSSKKGGIVMALWRSYMISFICLK